MTKTKVHRMPCKPAIEAFEKRLGMTAGGNEEGIDKIEEIPGSWLSPFREIARRFKQMQGKRADMLIERLSGVSNNVVRNVKGGEQKPNLELIGYYCMKEGYSADWILFGREYDQRQENFEQTLAKLLSYPMAERLRALVVLSQDVQEHCAEAECCTKLER